MCGIVAAVADRNIVSVLLEGLRKLEYRGYDSAGLALINDRGLQRLRAVGRVAELTAQVDEVDAAGYTGIAHTRWATHGVPSERNAHPHISHGLAVVHNGIIENHDELRAELRGRGYEFLSQTDTEVIAHLVDSLYDGDLFAAVEAALPRLKGAYAIAVFCQDEPQRVVGAREGSPLVLGVGQGENFLASDAMALAGVTDQIIYLEEGDAVDLQQGKYWITARGEGGAHPAGQAGSGRGLHRGGDRDRLAPGLGRSAAAASSCRASQAAGRQCGRGRRGPLRAAARRRPPAGACGAERSGPACGLRRLAGARAGGSSAAGLADAAARALIGRLSVARLCGQRDLQAALGAVHAARHDAPDRA